VKGTEIVELDETVRHEMRLKCLEAGDDIIKNFPDHIRKLL
jgi:hypothetical protein